MPDDEYVLIEAYCTDPKCDCRRVMLNVVGRQQGKRYLASVSFGFDRDDEFAGPFLDPLNTQSEYAGVLLEIVTQVLTNPTYVARLESHYRQIKAAAANPHDPAHEAIRQIRMGGRRWVTAANRAVVGARQNKGGVRKKRRKR